MYAIRTAAAITFLLTLKAASAQTCEDGACRLRPAPAGQRNPYSQYEPGRFELPAESFSNRRLPQACPNCECDGNYCMCGPNCPSHYESETSRFLSENPQRLPPPRATDHEYGYPAPAHSRPAASQLRAPTPRHHPSDSWLTQPQGIHWQSSFQQAKEMSRRSGKPILVQVSADWCSHCQRMKRETFADRRIATDISAGFIPVSLNADQNRELLNQLRVRSLPTTLVITPDMRIAERTEGFQSVNQLGTVLVRFLQRAHLDTGARLALR